MKNSIELTVTSNWVSFVNDKYFIDVRIDFRYNVEHKEKYVKTAGVAFLEHLDDSNEYGEGVCQQLTIRASETSNDEKKIIKKMIFDFSESLNHSEIILNHLKRNISFFEKRIADEKKVKKELKISGYENPEDDF